MKTQFDTIAPLDFSGSSTSLDLGKQGLFDLEYFGPATAPTAMELLNSFMPVAVAAFLVTLIAVPLVRWIAVSNGIVDHPDGNRKIHTAPIAYLGGVAVFVGLIGGIVTSYLAHGRGIVADYPAVPLAVVIGMFAILVTGVMDDVWGWDPRLKIAGQLVAAGGLAISDVGTQTAEGLLGYVLQPEAGDVFLPFVPETWYAVFEDGGDGIMQYFAPTYATIYYWFGVCLIAALVLAACNAANLIDGVDGLLTGSTSIMAVGFVLIAVAMAIYDGTQFYTAAAAGELSQWDPLSGARLVLSLSLLGATLGFLPYNFNPAVIFLGDAGSLLLGFVCSVLILSLGAEGNTQFVIAGLIVFGLPIIDTLLAVMRRKLAGLPMSAPDRNHIHHMVLRATGSVKRTALVLYLLTAAFVTLGVTLIVTSLGGEIRVLTIYAVAILIFGFVGAVALKTALRHRWMTEALQEEDVAAAQANDDETHAAG